MSTADYSALKKDIAAHGLMVPILTWQGAVIDGKERLRACQETGTKPQFQELPTTNLPEAIALRLNLVRRHLTANQRAMLAGKYATLTKGSNQHASRDASTLTQSQAARAFATSRASVQRALKILSADNRLLNKAVQSSEISLKEGASIAAMSPGEQKAHLKLASDIRKHQTADRRKAAEEFANSLNKNVPLPRKTFAIILADPPWDYGSQKISTTDVLPHGKYSLMSTAAIAALPIAKQVQPKALLFLWVPSSLIEDGLQVLQAWGFKYVASAVWVKPNQLPSLSMFLPKHELIFLGRKGSIGAPKEKFSSVIYEEGAKRGRHSAKPIILHEMIEKAFPAFPKLELFGRATRKGWVVWGNQSGEAKSKTNPVKPANSLRKI